MALSCSKNPSALLGRITFKRPGDLYFLNWLHSFATENNRKSHKTVCQNRDFLNVLMPSETIKILEFTQLQRSNKAPFVIYADFECSIEKLNACKILKKHWVHFLYYKWIESRYIKYRFFWVDKKQKATINPINKEYNKCFQYPVNFGLNH